MAKEVKEVTTDAVAQGPVMVAVRVLQAHECSIGDVKYKLGYGEEVKMPEDVATILSHAHIVMKK